MFSTSISAWHIVGASKTPTMKKFGQGLLSQDHDKVLGTKMSPLSILIPITEPGPKGHKRTRMIAHQVRLAKYLQIFLGIFVNFTYYKNS